MLPARADVRSRGEVLVEHIIFGEGGLEHPHMTAIGCGGAGCNIAKGLAALDIPGLEVFFLNQQRELASQHHHESAIVPLDLDHRKVSEPKHAEAATWVKHSALKEILKGSHLTFIICGLGGVTGSGAAPAVAEMARSHRNITVALTVHPFKIEGPRRASNTQWCLERLRDKAHGIVSIHNEKLMTLAPNISFGQALQVTNQMALMPIREIATLATKDDLRSIRHILECDDIHIGFGGSDRRIGLAKASEEVIESLMPGPGPDDRGCDRGLITIRAGPDVMDHEIENLVGILVAELHPKGKVLWGVIRDEALGHAVRMMAIMGTSRTISKTEK